MSVHNKSKSNPKETFNRPVDKGRAPSPRNGEQGDQKGGEGLDFPLVGIGASAGGLEEFKRFFDAMPAESGIAWVLIQHLHPSHESLAAKILAKHTAMAVLEVEDCMPVQVNCVYVIPPNKYLTLRDGRLHLSEPLLYRGIRMPIDYFFRSLAETQQDRAIGILLSGTGTDGTLGLKAIKSSGGMAMVQDPETAQYNNMVRSAIGAGLVDYVVPVEQMPAVLVQYLRHAPHIQARLQLPATQKDLNAILRLLHLHTPHDFHSYKEGVLLRRIGRRMGLRHIHDIAEYVDLLRRHPDEINSLFRDLLISVTLFFRDSPAFNVLAEEGIAQRVREKGAGESIRVWAPGCATGEEAYSLAILVTEQLEAAHKNCPLRIFATDIDAAALDVARAGIYPENIAADVSSERLQRFFTKEDSSYRVNKLIRETVTFALHNLVADPPFSRLDLISCRNLMIYLQPELQHKVIALFHFALAEGGYLFLGNTETIGPHTNLFEPITKKWRLYRRLATPHRNLIDFPRGLTAGRIGGGPKGVSRRPAPPASAQLAEITQRLLLERYAPAAVLVNRNYQVQYYQGPVDRYLKRPSGVPTHDLITQIRKGLHITLRAALHKATAEARQVTLSGAYVRGGEEPPRRVKITVDPLKTPKTAEGLLLIVFEEEPAPAEVSKHIEVKGSEEALIRQLEQDLKTTKEELQSTIEEMESANEELQSANEELETSKEELQSMNEELSAANSQLQSKLEELEAANNDLSNLLTSTDIATFFLDRQFHIKLFTPPTRRLFNVISTDLGRPINDITHKFQDSHLFHEAETVLDKLTPLEREVRTVDGRCYLQRLLPYQTQDKRIGGVVATFIDITERKQSEEALQEAKVAAEQANDQKSQFLAAASHDLRQPLQTLRLLNALLVQQIREQKILKLISQQGETLKVMEGLLNGLLDLAQLEAGTVVPQFNVLAADELFSSLKNEFGAQAREKGLGFRVRPCNTLIHSDRVLLERILHNFLSNAIKHTEAGKILIGGRNRGCKLRIEMWDTGYGIPADQLKAIFTEFYQLNNPARESSKGLGLGLAIADRLACLLGHRLHVRSRPDKGSVFGVEVPIATKTKPWCSEVGPLPPSPKISRPVTVLLIEDDPGVADALGTFLRISGMRVIRVSSGDEALAHMTQRHTVIPAILISDYHLPGGKTGLQIIRDIRQVAGHPLPAILLTGDTVSIQPHEAETEGCQLIHKPIAGDKLVALLNRLIKET